MTVSAFPSDFWTDRLASDVMGAGDDQVVSGDLWIVWRSTWDALMDLVREVQAEHDIEWCDADCGLAKALLALRDLAP